jgi:DNA-directed RNA polymerase specialized sigma24 family protein
MRGLPVSLAARAIAWGVARTPWRLLGRPLAPTPPVGAGRFQSSDEPFPRHWRWEQEPTLDTPPSEEELRRALETLPPLWREALENRDVRRLSPWAAAAKAGLTPGQERRLVNRARAAALEHVAEERAR